MPAQKFRWDESSSGDSAGEWRYVMPRKKRAKTATAQGHEQAGVTGFDRRRTYSEVVLNTQRDSESEQQNDVDEVGADSGANGAAAGTGVPSVTGEKRREVRERIQAALAQSSSGDDMKELRDKLNQEMSRTKNASEP